MQRIDWSIIVWFQDILQDAIDNDLTCVTQMAYFEGDFWPNIIEDCIRELNEEEEEEKHLSAIGDLMEVRIKLVTRKKILLEWSDAVRDLNR